MFKYIGRWLSRKVYLFGKSEGGEFFGVACTEAASSPGDKRKPESSPNIWIQIIVRSLPPHLVIIRKGAAGRNPS